MVVILLVGSLPGYYYYKWGISDPPLFFHLCTAVEW